MADLKDGAEGTKMVDGESADGEAIAFDALMARETLDDFDAATALDWIAQLVDEGGDRRDSPAIEKALGWCDSLEARNLDPRRLAVLNYFRANAWAITERLRIGSVEGAGKAEWLSWEQPEAEHQIFCLRSAANSPAFSDLALGRRCQILTNLAGQLSGVGRPADALEPWGRVLALAPRFWMARGNRGVALKYYGLALHDPGHQAAFLLFAYRDLERACAPDQESAAWGEPAALEYFGQHKRHIEGGADVRYIAENLQLDGHNLGRSRRERAYRAWCLRQGLFLNPLNDLGPHTIAAQDSLSLPDFVTDMDEPPVVTGFFNQMKQEFVSARWEYYLGVIAESPHFSDRKVLLYNTLDYPSHSLAVERMKGAYRVAYSLFDKIAFFLNHYLSLGVKVSNVSFRSIWREKNGDAIHPIRTTFRQSENWPLRGLFWLSKDLFDERQKAVTDPDAQALHELRINLEHRYVKVLEMPFEPTPIGEPSDPFFDTLAYRISRRSLEERTLRLLKLARAALIHLSLAMHSEERRRATARGPGLTASMPLDPIRDSWKR